MNSEKRLTDLQLLINEFKRSGLRELQSRHGDFEIYLSQDADAPGLGASVAGPSVQVQRTIPAMAGSTLAAQPVAAAAPAPLAHEVFEGAIIVSAPYLGTFYRSPKPGSPPYVEVGSIVTAQSELCLIEVMKLFTAVRAGLSGKVVQVLVNDGELVASDQPLFAVMPA